MRVWAPYASQVELVIDEATEPRRHVMHKSSGGWWEGEELKAGTRYGFSLDGSQPRPDPRSRRQPEGVHGWSEVVDPTSFSWSDDQWRGVNVQGALIYELHIGTFTPEGTFSSARERLPYLSHLGVDIVEIMPIAPVPGKWNWGYDGVSLFAVTENYGGPHEFAAFVDEAHKLGIGVCLDVVYNHLGPEGNYLSIFGPYFTDKHETPWGQGVNLDDEGSQEVRRYFIDNALQWIRDYHVDALRLDAVAFLKDDSPRHFLAELSDYVHTFAREHDRIVGLIAESDLNDPIMVTPTNLGGRGMDGQWDDDIHHALHTFLTGESFGYYADFTAPGALEKALRHVFVHDGNMSTFREKEWGKPVPNTMSGHLFVASTQTHDQVGNRAIGDRPGRQGNLGDDLTREELGRLAAQNALLLTSPYTPMLFMGQEWATTSPFQFFTNHGGELGQLVEAGRQAEFDSWDWLSIYDADVRVPSPEDPATFTRSHLDWNQRERGAHRDYSEFISALIRLRRENPELRSGNRSDYDLVRLAGSGYVRRGDFFVVFSIATTAPDPDARLNVPDYQNSSVLLPTLRFMPLLAWGAYSQEDGSTWTRVTFDEPGVIVGTMSPQNT